MWRVALADAGVTVETVDAGHVRLGKGDRSKVATLRRLSALTPSRVPELDGGPGLLAAPRATERAVAAAVARGWDVVTDSGRYSLRIGDSAIVSSDAAEGRARRHPGPPSWALFTVARRLLAGPALSGSALAQASGVSQSRCSRVLARLVDGGLARRDRDGYRPTDWRQLLEWWLENYPGDAGALSYWASVKDVATQVRDAQAALGDHECAVSGDPAADILAPWRVPTFAVVYAKRGAPLGDHGFVPVGGREEATLALCAPVDPGVWLPTAWTVRGLPLADPLQIVHDVADGPEPDRREAADRLVEALAGPHKSRWRRAAIGALP
ncbi:MAG: winged helix-turn-helix domain-containing protein [Propionibacteriaceae bacterium]|jgi:hypothetical protein|nr:winged helix-turn-helix domain-containing protein [Propionibacteriaceae bacterium]